MPFILNIHAFSIPLGIEKEKNFKGLLTELDQSQSMTKNEQGLCEKQAARYLNCINGVVVVFFSELINQ